MSSSSGPEAAEQPCVMVLIHPASLSGWWFHVGMQFPFYPLRNAGCFCQTMRPYYHQLTKRCPGKCQDALRQTSDMHVTLFWGRDGFLRNVLTWTQCCMQQCTMIFIWLTQHDMQHRFVNRNDMSPKIQSNSTKWHTLIEITPCIIPVNMEKQYLSNSYAMLKKVK